MSVHDCIVRNYGLMERVPGATAAAAYLLKKLNPTRIDDLRFETAFSISYALTSEKNSEKFRKVMRRLESYLGSGPFGPKKYWEYPWALGNLRIEPGMSVLDAGCGRSPVQYLLADLAVKVSAVDAFEDATWHGIDRRLARRFSCDIDYRKEDIAHLSFADNTFDRVMCLSVLEHCRKSHAKDEKMAAQTADDRQMHRDTISEMLRVLKPRGRLVITVDFNIPRDNCLLASNIDVRDLITHDGMRPVARRARERFFGEEGFSIGDLIMNSDIYIENYADTLQTSIGIVLEKL